MLPAGVSKFLPLCRSGFRGSGLGLPHFIHNRKTTCSPQAMCWIRDGAGHMKLVQIMRLAPLWTGKVLLWRWLLLMVF